MDDLLRAVRGGRSQVLLLRGQAGVGKSALLDYLVERASGFRFVRATGVESEMELAYAGLHLVSAPLLDHLASLPKPQQDALSVALALTAGMPPDRFLVALAVLSLLTDASETEPLICVVDDAQWLDRESAQAMAFVARRLLAERVALVFAMRDGTADGFDELPSLAVPTLDRSSAGRLLDSVLKGSIDDRVRRRVLVEARGNPLALREFGRDLSQFAMAGGFGGPDSRSLAGRIEEEFASRLASLPTPSRSLALTAAAEPTGDPILLWRAADRLGIPRTAATAAQQIGLLEVGAHVTFHHPLARSAVYRSGSETERAAVHQALAEATDPGVDPDRRAWHRASAALRPDEEIALELERSAGRAQSRGGLAAAAAFLQRAAKLTEEPSHRTDRALSAALATLQAGAFDAALGLVTEAETGPLDEAQRATAEMVRGQVTFASSAGGDASSLLLSAARRLEAIDPSLARAAYLDAWGAALFAGRMATAGGLLDVSRSARRAPAPAHEPRPSDLLLDALATLITEGRDAAAPMLRGATDAFASHGISAEESFRWGWLTTLPAEVLWDDERWHLINLRQIERAREVGALARLPIALIALAILVAWRGDFTSAAAAIDEADAISEATQAQIPPFGAIMLGAMRGDAGAVALVDAAIAGAAAARQGGGVQYAQWVASILYNGLGRHDQALAASRHACDDDFELFLSAWALPELIEASVMTGRLDLARDAQARLSRAADTAGNDWALGIEARSRALLSDGDDGEAAFRTALDRLARTRFPTELARAHLLFGEWLARAGRRGEARAELRTALQSFIDIGMGSFAERARGALRATGEKVPARASIERSELNSQEARIARLAADGLSNLEIGAQLFLSHRTVEWHLHRIFTKLHVTSRGGLRRHLNEQGALPA